MHATLVCPLIGGWGLPLPMQSPTTAASAGLTPTGVTVRFYIDHLKDVPTHLVSVSVQTFATEFARRHSPVVAGRFHAMEPEL